MAGSKSHKSKFYLMLYGFTSGIFINIIGRLIVSELIAVLSFPFLNIRSLLKEYRGLRTVYKVLMFMLVNQIISDMYNNTPYTDYLRGWSVIIFSIISVTFLVRHLSSNRKNIIPFLFSLFIVRLFFGKAELDIGMIEENSNFFKIRFVSFINLGMLILGYILFRARKERFVYLVYFMYALLCFALDARSNGLIFISTAMLLFIKSKRIKFSKGKVIVLSIMVSIVFYIGYVCYVNKVIYDGFGGSNAKIQISKMTNPYNPFELLFHGRVAVVIASYAVMDKPLLGHGSWAKDKTGKYSKLLEELTETSIYNDHGGVIPNHSLLIGTWLFSGILGFLGVCYLLVFLIKEFFKIYKSKYISPILPVLTVLTMDMCWAMMFSPYGLLRTTFPLFAALIVIYKREYEQIQMKQ